MHIYKEWRDEFCSGYGVSVVSDILEVDISFTMHVL